MSQVPPDADRLRAKRQALADQRRNDELRLSSAPNLVAILNRVLDRSLSLHDFSELSDTATGFVWPIRIEDAPGLVASYIDRPTADRILNCIERHTGLLEGSLGFHDKAFLGFARVREVSLASLAAIAFESKDSVLFFVDEPRGAVLVDYYESSQNGPYSVVVQGTQLVAVTSSCLEPGAGSADGSLAESPTSWLQ